MIINQTQGQANVMGVDRRFAYDHEQTSLIIRDISFADAQALVGNIEGDAATVMRRDIDASVPRETPRAGGAGAGERQLALVVGAGGGGGSLGTSNGVGSNGKGVTVDTAKIAALAQSNPKPAPKPEKPKRATKEEKAAADKAATTAADVEEADIPFPEGTEVAASETEDGDVEVEAAAAPPPKPKATNGAAKAKPAGEVSEELLACKKLRDVLNHIIDVEKLGVEDDLDGNPAVTDIEAIKARCTSLKELVPCLSRIPDLDSRIERTLEVMNLGADLT